MEYLISSGRGEVLPLLYEQPFVLEIVEHCEFPRFLLKVNSFTDKIHLFNSLKSSKRILRFYFISYFLLLLDY